MPNQRPPRFSPHALKALGRTGLVILLMVAVSYILSNNLLGPFSVFLKGPQSSALDQLSRAIYNLASPVAIRNFPLVVLVNLEETSINQLSPQGYVFDRGQMARLVEKIGVYRPKGVFLDFDLSQATNEGGVRSTGDERLLQAMRRVQYPLLLPDSRLLGLPLEQVNANLHPVTAQVLYDSDGQTRLIPKPQEGQPIAASLGLYCLGVGLDAGDGATCRAKVARGNPKADGKRIIYREIKRFREGSGGNQLWPGLVVVSGLELLQGGLVQAPATEGALFLVGRTFPQAADVHFTPVGPLQGIDIHTNATLTLATYRQFSETLPWGPVLVVVPILVFMSLWLTYSISDGLLRVSRFQNFVNGLIETPVAAWLLFFAGVVVVQYFGYYLDYLYPIAAFQLALLGIKLFKKGGKNVPAEEAAH